MNDRMAELRDLVDRHCVAERMPTALRGLSLNRFARTTAPDDAMYRPSLCVAVDGRKRVVSGANVITYDARSFVLATADVPVRGCVVEATPDRPYLGLVLDLDPRTVAEAMLALPPVPKRRDKPAGIVHGRMDGELADALTRLVRLLDRPGDAAFLQPLIDREIAFRLLACECGDIVRQLATAGSYLAEIARAAGWIKNNYNAPFKIERLARDAGMSATSFNRHFRAVIAMSPLQYRTQVRLQEARRLLLADGDDVGAIGMRVGYESASHFSRDYRKVFGMPPAADAARLRRGARAEPMP